MKTRKLGWTDLNLTTIGLGTWAIGGGDWTFAWGPQDDQESLAAILRGIEGGINWIDTAPAYGLGHSEEIVGKALKKLPQKPIIATKCGIVWDKNRKTSHQLKASDYPAGGRSQPQAVGHRCHRPVPDTLAGPRLGTRACLAANSEHGERGQSALCRGLQLQYRTTQAHPADSSRGFSSASL